MWKLRSLQMFHNLELPSLMLREKKACINKVSFEFLHPLKWHEHSCVDNETWLTDSCIAAFLFNWSTALRKKKIGNDHTQIIVSEKCSRAIYPPKSWSHNINTQQWVRFFRNGKHSGRSFSQKSGHLSMFKLRLKKR